MHLEQRTKATGPPPSPRQQSGRGLPAWCGALHLPAVDHYGPGFWGVEELDLADKAQEAGGVAGDAVVGPAGEVEEPQLPDLVVAFLRREGASVPLAAAPPALPSTHASPEATSSRIQPPCRQGGQGPQRVNRCCRDSASATSGISGSAYRKTDRSTAGLLRA